MIKNIFALHNYNVTLTKNIEMMNSIFMTGRNLLWALIISMPVLSFGQVTQLRNDFCGATLTNLGDNIYANKITGAQAYRFRMVNLNTSVVTIFETPNRWFNLVNAGANPLNNQTFQVDVAVNMGSGFGAYGPICTVNTPIVASATTQLTTAFCGAQIAALNTNIFANNVSGAAAYRFRLVNQNTSVVTIFDTPNRWFNLLTAGAQPLNNQIFEVQVAVDLGTGFGAFGPMCLIFTPIVPEPTTKIRADFCGTYLPTLGTNIFADNVTGAQAYRFRITNVITNVTIIHDRPNRWFNLITAGANPQIAQQYLIDVAVNIGGGFGPYGQQCFVFTPHVTPTQIHASHCGTTKSLLFYEYFNAVPNANADLYQFRIRNGNFESFTPPTASNETRFFDFASYAYGTSYNVDVRIRVNGVWGPYGPSCTISTIAEPFTQLQTNQYGGTNYCNAQLPSISSTIYAFGIPLITAYRFRVSQGSYVDSVQTSIRSFKLTDLPNFNSNLVFGVPYNVEVAVQFNGSFTPYGVMCQVFTPQPVTQLRADFCGATLTSNGQNIFADAVTGATQYRFEIVRNNITTIVTSNNRWFNLVNSGIASPNTVYTVRVAIGVNGFFYDYGPACTVQTPPGIMMSENLGVVETDANDENSLVISSETNLSITDYPWNDNNFNVTAYPNPANLEFEINITGVSNEELINVNIFDASGALVYSINGDCQSVLGKKFGRELAPGVYFVHINSLQRAQTIRIIKNN